jgi:hypothetical protein
MPPIGNSVQVNCSWLSEVRLVLLRVASLAQPPASAVVLDAGIVTGRHVRRAQRTRLLQQRAELQFLVAEHARAGRAPRAILGHKRVNHQLVKPLLLVHDVVWDAELLRHCTGVRHRLRPATLVRRDAHARLRPEFHRDPDDLMTLVQQAPHGDAGIHAAAHADDHAQFHQ